MKTFSLILTEFEVSVFLALEERRTNFPVSNDLVSRLNLSSRPIVKE